MSTTTSDFIEKTICDETNDFVKVLREVAIGCSRRGFFSQSNWMEILTTSFSDIHDRPDSANTNDDEIDNTFSQSITDEPTSSRFRRKNKTTDVQSIRKSPLNDQFVVADITADMFDEPFTQAKPPHRSMSTDSNESFEIPETQPNPQRNLTDDDLNSEGFIGIPDEDFATFNECNSQSQDLLGGVSLFDRKVNVCEAIVEERVLPENRMKYLNDDVRKSAQTEEDVTKSAQAEEDVTKSARAEDVVTKSAQAADDFENHDGIDLDMSKLEWEDTTKEEDNSRSASVTPDLDFDLLSSTKTCDLDLASVASNFGLNWKNPQLDDPKEVETCKDVISAASNLPTSCETSNELTEEAECANLDETQLFAKEASPHREKISDADKIQREAEDMEKTQIFAKPKLTSNNKSMVDVISEASKLLTSCHNSNELTVEAECADVVETQLLVKEISPQVADKNQLEAEDMEATQMFAKPKLISNKKSKVDKNDVISEASKLLTSCHNSNELTVEAECADVVETQLFVKEVSPQVADKKIEAEDMEETQMFAKPKLISNKKSKVENRNDVNEVIKLPSSSYISEDLKSLDANCEDVATQIFSKDVSAQQRTINNAVQHQPEEDDVQIFVKPTLSLNYRLKINNNDDDKPSNTDENLDETQLFVKANDVENDDADVYEMATQQLEISKPSRKRNRLMCSSDEEDDSNGELLIPLKIRTPSPTTSSSKSSKTTKPNSFAENMKTEVTNGIEAAAADEIVKNEKYKFLEALKESSWSQICSTVNEQQSKIKYINVFDQCKEIELIAKNDAKVVSVNVAPENNAKVVSVNVAPENNSEMIVKNDVKVASVSVAPQNNAKDVSNFVEPTANVRKSSRTRISSRKIVENSLGKILALTTSVENKTPITVSNQIISPKISLVSSTPPANAKLEEANESKDEMEDATQKFVKESRDKKKASSRAKKTVDTTTKSDQNQDDQHQLQSIQPITTKISVKESETIDTLSHSNSPISSNSSMNRSSRNQHLRVIFTMIDPAPHKPILKQLNIIMVNSDETYDALVTDRVYRSTKFMCALASGKPIVSTEWLKTLKERKTRVDPFEFLLKDKDGEKKFKFSLAKTIAKSKKCGLFAHHSIIVTPSTSPEPEVLKDVITSSSGKYLKQSLVPRKDDAVLCVSDRKDQKMWPQLKKKYPNLTSIINVEGFMQAIFQYNLNVKEYSLEK